MRDGEGWGGERWGGMGRRDGEGWGGEIWEGMGRGGEGWRRDGRRDGNYKGWGGEIVIIRDGEERWEEGWGGSWKAEVLKKAVGMGGGGSHVWLV